MKNNKRPDWDEYFFSFLDIIATRSTCLRRQIGALITKNNRIVATGYNGQPPGVEHCTDRGFCLREKLKVPSGQRHELCRVIHAEQNAIYQASHFGTSLEGATIYSNLIPCSLCTKAILSVGITRVVYKGTYDDEIGKNLRKEAKWVKFELYKPPVEKSVIRLYLDEIFKPLKGFEGFEISNYGRVFKNNVYRRLGILGEHVEPEFKIEDNQYFITIRNLYKNTDECISVAYLVANSWIDNPKECKNVRWKDGNTSNNHVNNLEWV